MTRRWWRRNAIALGWLAVLLPVTALAIGGGEWWVMNQARPVLPTTVDPGATTEWAGMQWGPATLTAQPADRRSAPPAGTKVLVAEVVVDPGDAPTWCSAPILRELHGEQRQWDEATSSVDWEYDRPVSCESDADARYTIAAPFLVPDDAHGPFAVEFTVVDELPGFLRLVVP